MTGTLAIAGLLLLGFLCQWVAWRVRLPAILFLLLTGIVIGPVLRWAMPASGLDPDAVFGDLLLPFVSVGVAVILFEGSLTLRFSEVRGLGPAILNMVSIGAAVSFFGLAAAAHLLAGLDWPLALLFGAVTCVTGPTVILPMLRTVRPRGSIANILRWEGIIIDPIGALLAVVVFEAVALGHGDDGLEVFVRTILFGALIGAAAALGLSYLLRRHRIPEYLQNYAALAAVLLAFAVSNALTEESGLLAVTVMGILMANQRGVRMEGILDFKEHLSTLLISMLFIVLAARLEAPTPALLLSGLLILVAAMLVIRPLAVLVGSLGAGLEWRERALLAWFAPRGIVAAAVSSVFALKLEARGIAGADTLVPLTFLLIIGTVVIYSATALPFARWLRVADPEPSGVLVVGASRVGLAMAEALSGQGYDVVVADDDWNGIRAARMAGLRTYYGDPVSEHADRHLDLVGIGWLLAMSTSRERNTLACVRFAEAFGKDHVYFLRNLTSEEGKGRKDYARPLQAPNLFGDDITHDDLARRLDEGWVVKRTRLTDTFDFAQFTGQYAQPPFVLFARTDAGRLRIPSSVDTLEPKPDWTITALVDPARRLEPATDDSAAVADDQRLASP